jgi:hypothetical protein
LVYASEETTDDWAKHRRSCKNSKEHSLVASTLARRNDVGQNSQREGEQTTGTDTLNRTPSRKLEHVGRGATK